MKRFLVYVRLRWRRITGLAVLAIGFLSLLTYHLGSLTGGLSADELQAQHFAGNWHHLSQNSLLLPFTALQWLALRLGGHTIIATRLPSVGFGLLSVVALAYVLRRWYGPRTAAFGTIVFATSAWLLHVSRFAGPEAAYLAAVPVLFAVVIYWERHARSLTAHYLVTAVLAALIYLPGLIWLMLLYFGLHTQPLRQSWRQISRPWQRISIIVVFVVLLLPLGYSLLRHSDLIATWLGLPKHFARPGAMGRQLIHSFSFFVWRGPARPQLWLDRLPVISLFSIAMLVLGSYFYGRHLTATRTRLLVGLFALAAAFYALNGPVQFSILVPIVYLVVTGGIGFLLHEWLRIFPRNPLARAAGYTLISLLVILSCSYELRAYFIAWPHNRQTIAVFSENYPESATIRR